MVIRHYENVRKAIGEDTDLCVVSKKRSIEEIRSYYEAGERIFGENHAQELLEKVPQLPMDIQWHFIGHLQRNKVKSILPIISCIQSLDSYELADAIEKEAAKINKTIPVLLEFHMASTDTNKTGHDPSDALPFAKYCMDKPHLEVGGIMVMGPHTDDTKAIEAVFVQAHDLFVELQSIYSKETIHTLSMGMSSDYKTAIKCGTTMVRIGTYLFEED